MAIMLVVTIDYCEVPDGTGSTMLGQQQSNFPGYGAVPGVGVVPAGQTARDIVGEVVPGGDSPTDGNFQTALNNAAADAYTRATTANSVPGFTAGKLTDQMRAWSTGGA